MPIFDFSCLRCKQEFEFLIIREGEVPRCPECGSASVERQGVAPFSCTEIQLTKRLKLESADRMQRGMKQMREAPRRKERIKII